MMFIRLHNKW